MSPSSARYPAETRLERVEMPDLVAIARVLEDPLQRLNVPVEGFHRLLGFANSGD